MKAFYFCAAIFSVFMFLLSACHLGYAQLESSPLYSDIASFDNNKTEENFEIIDVMPFNNTYPSSITVDPVSNHVYVSVRPDFSYNNLSQSCFGQNTVASNNASYSIYVRPLSHFET